MPPEIAELLQKWGGLSAATVGGLWLLWRVLRMIGPSIFSGVRTIGTALWGIDPSVMDARRLLAADEETFRKSVLKAWTTQGEMMADMDRRLRECLQHHEECERMREIDHQRLARVEAKTAFVPFPGDDS